MKVKVDINAPAGGTGITVESCPSDPNLVNVTIGSVCTTVDPSQLARAAEISCDARRAALEEFFPPNL